MISFLLLTILLNFLTCLCCYFFFIVVLGFEEFFLEASFLLLLRFCVAFLCRESDFLGFIFGDFNDLFLTPKQFVEKDYCCDMNNY